MLTQEQIIEGNNIIQEFIQNELCIPMKTPSGQIWGWTNALGDERVESQNLPYHTSIEALHKIITEKFAHIPEFDGNEPLDNVSLYSPTWLIYESVVEGIKWYYEETKRNNDLGIL